MLDKVLSMPPVLNIQGIWIAQDSEYISGSQFCRVLDIPGILSFWIYQSSEYARVIQVSEYAWIIPEYVWICLIMSRYFWICLNMPDDGWIWLSGFCFIFPYFPICFTIHFLLEHVITYLNIYRRLEVIVWWNMKLFSWRDKIWFFLKQLEVLNLLFVLD